MLNSDSDDDQPKKDVKSYVPMNLGSVKGRWDQIEAERKKIEEEKAMVCPRIFEILHEKYHMLTPILCLKFGLWMQHSNCIAAIVIIIDRQRHLVAEIERAYDFVLWFLSKLDFSLANFVLTKN